MLDLTVIILTYNEEVNIEKCIRSVQSIATKVLIIDSYSVDKTVEICKRMGTEVYQHEFVTHSEQFNWAIENIEITTEWILRLDADESLLPELSEEFIQKLPNIKKNVNGINLRRRVIFMGKWIKHGGVYPVVLLRAFRRGTAYYEDVNMNEHLILKEGSSITFEKDFVDDNNKSLSWWMRKQNAYTDKTVIDNIMHKTSDENKDALIGKMKGSQSEKKRWVINNVYDKLPYFFRGKIYYIYRYYFKLGFLDGIEGKIFHFLQGYVMLFLTDAKMVEWKKRQRGKSKNDSK